MDEVKMHIDTAFALLSRIPVTGDAVDLMSAARKELRAAYAVLKSEQEEDTHGG